MKEAVIKKLSLTPTDFNFGQTFYYNIITYLYKDNIHVAACTLAGYPDNANRVLFFRGSKTLHFSIDALLDMSLDSIDKILSDKI